MPSPTEKKSKQNGKKKKIRRKRVSYTKPASNPSWFKPGWKGGPGRPKLTPDQVATVSAFRQACRERTPEAMVVIEELMQRADRDGVRLNAAQYVIDQGQGTAVIRTELTGKDGGPIQTQDVTLTREEVLAELTRRGLPTSVLSDGEAST